LELEEAKQGRKRWVEKKECQRKPSAICSDKNLRIWGFQGLGSEILRKEESPACFPEAPQKQHCSPGSLGCPQSLAKEQEQSRCSVNK
jgi:hypothetical protein